MKIIEDRLAHELEQEASRVPVNTASVWFGTMRRTTATRTPERSPVRTIGIAVAASTGVLTAAVGVPVGAHLLQPDDPGRQATGGGWATSTKPDQSPGGGTQKPWQYTFTTPPDEVVDKIEPPRCYGKATEAVPVDYRPDGDFVMYAYLCEDSAGDDLPPSVFTQIGIVQTRLADGEQPTAPPLDPQGSSEDMGWTVGANEAAYPEGTSRDDAEWWRSSGNAPNEVDRLVAIDDQGRRHEAELAGGKDAGWPAQHWFVIVPNGTQLESYIAYDADGERLDWVPNP